MLRPDLRCLYLGGPEGLADCNFCAYRIKVKANREVLVNALEEQTDIHTHTLQLITSLPPTTKALDDKARFIPLFY